MKSLFTVGVPNYTGNSREQHYWEMYSMCSGAEDCFFCSPLDKFINGYAGLDIPGQTLFSVSRQITHQTVCCS